MSNDMIQLPFGDLWRPPVINEETGEMTPRERPDTVSTAGMPAPRAITPDVTAILMADLARQGQAPK